MYSWCDRFNNRLMLCSVAILHADCISYKQTKMQIWLHEKQIQVLKCINIVYTVLFSSKWRLILVE